jgi:hypothetical protein
MRADLREALIALENDVLAAGRLDLAQEVDHAWR